MGEMASNIAHQWRQPLSELSGIFMNLSAAKKLGKLTDEKFFEKIEEGSLLINYMSHTIEDFRNFYSGDQYNGLFQIEHAYHKAIRILEASILYFHIDLRAECVSCTVFGDENQMAQALLNVLSNARDAVAKNRHGERNIWVRIFVEESVCKIEIEDNGGGIKVEPISEIFEPYITTKTSSEGTGIGLYMSKMIAERHGGSLSACNTENGAKFIFTLPII